MKTKQKVVMALKIWAIIYPSITLFLFLFGSQLDSAPLYARTLILTIFLVPWMTFIGMPVLDFLIRRYSEKKQKIQYDKFKQDAPGNRF